MEILRFSLPEHDVGDEWRFVRNLRQIGISEGSIHIDKKLAPPHIIVEIYSREIGDVVRTIARIRHLNREQAPPVEELNR